ncbi:glycoside hydrolase family 88 protein [Dysgonomonas sp. BGC7]|uniref:glycoside hydrolase family 88 protein n=1 Tax=Dysgonomonas sp. BGC7 TaxID=1658008 RepID=UPI0006828E8E|nr:glycoside hydrolase family 88 protein [Dysgonomonas sp. BGC7]MBD8387738.1 glycoside hydrolase family 88 protein [Dysgonomonas sp. BGC7]
MSKLQLGLIAAMAMVSIWASGKTIVVNDKMSTKAINNRLASLQGGDTLLLKKGYYHVNLLLSNKTGIHDKPIVIRGEDRKNTTIDGGATVPDSNLKNYGIYIENSSWVTIDNLSFKNCWVDVVRAYNSSYISLTNSTIEGGRRALFAEGRKSHHFLVEGCYWEQGEHVWTKEDKYSWSELHHGEFKHYNGSIFQAKMISGSFVIRDNYIKNVYNGIRLSIMGDAENDTLACTNGEIYRNVIENSADNAFEPEVYCKNLHFYHNKMINSHAFISVTEVGGGPIYFYGNTGVKLPDCNDGWTIFKTAGRERRLTAPFYIFNNSWQVDSDVLGSVNTSYWHNDNIHHFNNAYHLSHNETVGIYHLGKNNLFENDCANIPFPDKVIETGRYPSIVADPMFVDGKYGNFLLEEGSPCKDAGIVLDNFPIYYTGDKLDIGAYDDGKLVEGPVFRYVEPGEEMPEQEMPRIVKHKIENNTLKLWFSYPLSEQTIRPEYFALNGITFQHFSLHDDNYLLVLTAKENLPQNNIYLSVSDKPESTKGERITTWASSIATQPMTKAEEVLQLTKKAADNLILNTLFDFEPKVITFNANVSRLQIDKAILDSANKIAYGAMSINSQEGKEVTFGFSFRGDIKLYLNGKLIFTGESKKEQFEEYTYNRFRFDNELKINLNKGENCLLVKVSGKNKGLDFTCCALKSNREFDKAVEIKNNIADSHINNWLITESLETGFTNVIDSIFEPERTMREYYTYNGQIVSWHMQQPTIQQALKVSPFTKNKKGFNADWHYANSNTILGIQNLYKASNDYNYQAFVYKYNKHIFDNYQFFKKQYLSDRVLRGTYFRLFRATMLDDTSGAALPLAETASIAFTQPLHKEILEQTLDYVLNKQSRLADGTLCRPEPIEQTVWADDMFMSVPFLLRMAKLNNDKMLYDEAALQVLQMNKHLTDRNTNLCRHGWFDKKGELSPVAWSRANGWIVWAMSETLMEIPVTHKDYKKIKDIFTKRLVTLLKYQSDNGLWHQIADDSDSYLETSGSAMFGLALARAINNKWISYQYAPQLIKAWNAVAAQIDEKGVVHGICQGTDMGMNADYYKSQKTLDSDPRGMGAILTFGTEMYYFFNKK